MSISSIISSDDSVSTSVPTTPVTNTTITRTSSVSSASTSHPGESDSILHADLRGLQDRTRGGSQSVPAEFRDLRGQRSYSRISTDNSAVGGLKPDPFPGYDYKSGANNPSEEPRSPYWPLDVPIRGQNSTAQAADSVPPQRKTPDLGARCNAKQGTESSVATSEAGQGRSIYWPLDG
ncbi:hypothetical protein MMC28_009809 [Mycoblastus sanguinarius]|nr:hypothetical protein [Mycoblastus sanguinarius]